ncbi:TPA: hypothetical protein PBB95_002758 [Staphylococcus aureus]|nr:hypothetical protein [Staphylococcus aureus]
MKIVEIRFNVNEEQQKKLSDHGVDNKNYAIIPDSADTIIYFSNRSILQKALDMLGINTESI